MGLISLKVLFYNKEIQCPLCLTRWIHTFPRSRSPRCLCQMNWCCVIWLLVNITSHPHLIQSCLIPLTSSFLSSGKPLEFENWSCLCVCSGLFQKSSVLPCKRECKAFPGENIFQHSFTIQDNWCQTPRSWAQVLSVCGSFQFPFPIFEAVFAAKLLSPVFLIPHEWKVSLQGFYL